MLRSPTQKACTWDRNIINKQRVHVGPENITMECPNLVLLLKLTHLFFIG